MCVFHKAIVSILFSGWYIEWDFLDVVSVSYYLFLCFLESWNKWTQPVNSCKDWLHNSTLFWSKNKDKEEEPCYYYRETDHDLPKEEPPDNSLKKKTHIPKPNNAYTEKFGGIFYLLLDHVKDTSHSSSSFISHTMCMIIEGQFYKAMQCARVANQLGHKVKGKM